MGENGMRPADISAMVNGNRGMFGGDGGAFWLLVLFLFGMNGGGWGYGNGNVSAEIQNGFNNQSVQAALGNLTNIMTNGFADSRFSIAQENCADRQVFNDGFRDLISAGNTNTQLIIAAINNGIQKLDDKLCQLELDSLKSKNNEQASIIASLQAQIATMQNNAYLISQLKPASTT